MIYTYMCICIHMYVYLYTCILTCIIIYYTYIYIHQLKYERESCPEGKRMSGALEKSQQCMNIY